jgi:hypothetical protein
MSEDSSASSSSEIEDDLGYLDTTESHLKFLSVFPKIASRSREIYSVQAPLFEAPAAGPPAALRPAKPAKPKMTVRDLVLRSTGDSSESEAGEEEEKALPPTIAAQREQARQEFMAAAAASDGEGEDELFKISKPAHQPTSSQPRPGRVLEDFWDVTRHDQLTETDRYLRDYIVNERWKVDPKLDEEDEDAVQKMEEYETEFAFRHQHPDAMKIPSYPREITTSLRKPKTKRKEERERKKERKLKKQLQMQEDLKKTKKQARREIEEQLAAGLTDDLGTPVGDHPEQQQSPPPPPQAPRTFKELMERTQSQASKSTAGAAADRKYDELLEQYYNLDCEDILEDGTPCRFKYVKVKPETGGLTIDEIFELDDETLEKFAPMKYFAPYQVGDLPFPKRRYKPWRDSSNRHKLGDKGKRPRAFVPQTEDIQDLAPTADPSGTHHSAPARSSPRGSKEDRHQERLATKRRPRSDDDGARSSRHPRNDDDGTRPSRRTERTNTTAAKRNRGKEQYAAGVTGEAPAERPAKQGRSH